MAIIEVNHVEKSFLNHEVLKDISFRVEEGEIFGLLGPSGAGKTTLIKILIGQLHADRGTTCIFGAEYKSKNNNKNESKNNSKNEKAIQNVNSKIGVVLDNCGLYERLSCWDNLIIFAKIHGNSHKEILEVLSRVGLTEAAGTPAGKLSKGMKQRLILARSLMHKPKLLFLDEPTSGLDPGTAAQIHQLLYELREKGTTIFLTTHNMDEATKLCNNVALLNEGIIVEYGVMLRKSQKYFNAAMWKLYIPQNLT
ncbi:MAG: transporter ATP-binding protein [Anaerocolumna sp.]|nr:transporter ATP-binding protein [Anaerocolumna sp.]